MKVSVQETDFDAGAELKMLALEDVGTGAIVSFVGRVRVNKDSDSVHAMTLEHYPTMTLKALERIVNEACERWEVRDATVIHRVGRLPPGGQIVFVAVASSHRGDAFAACEFIMDYLKTRAPFWKREETAKGERWVEAQESDDAAAERWVES
jgi:molybdopterin synthase catalytic subunit